MEQLWGAIGAVFNSWKIPRACTYRALMVSQEDWGTGVTCKPWYLAIWATIVQQALPLHATPSTG